MKEYCLTTQIKGQEPSKLELVADRDSRGRLVPRTFDNSIAANYAADRMAGRLQPGTTVRVHEYYGADHSTNNGFEDAVCIEGHYFRASCVSQVEVCARSFTF